MTRLFFGLLLALTCSAAPPGVRQVAYGESSDSGSCTVVFSQPVLAGSLIGCGHRPSGGGTVTSVSLSGRTFVRDARAPIVTEFSLEVHSLSNATAGGTSVSSSITGVNDQHRMWIWEITNAATSGTVTHKTNFSMATGSATVNPGNLVTTVDGCIIISIGASDGDMLRNDGSTTPGAGYTLFDSGIAEPNAPDKSAVQWRIATTAGSYATSMVDNQTMDWAAIAVAYLPAEAGGGASPASYRNKGKAVSVGFGPMF